VFLSLSLCLSLSYGWEYSIGPGTQGGPGGTAEGLDVLVVPGPL